MPYAKGNCVETISDRKVTNILFPYFPINSYNTELKKKPSTVIRLIPSWGKSGRSWQQI